jgi:RNA-splicing ligase RtcB
MDMNFALEYAKQNRQRLMDRFMAAFSSVFTEAGFEAPQAYKDIDTVIEAELDLIKPIVKLRPLAVVKG